MNAIEFKKLFLRDLDKLTAELDAYNNEETLWLKTDGINNAAGNLFMHICGNLQHFVGAVLGETGYKRKRDFEFNGRMTVEEIRTEIENTKEMISDYFNEFNIDALQSEYPLQPFEYPMTIGYFLNHLLGHLNYHLGQINYHRRLLPYLK